MADKRRKFDAEFREGAVRIVAETGRSVRQVARDLGINETAGELGAAGHEGGRERDAERA